MDTDIQIGGTDQTFNMQAGRTLQKKWRNKESFVLAMEFLTGTDGRKMSKSWGNAIWLEDNPEDMYAKVMAIHDDVIIEYFKLATKAPMEKVREVATRLEKGENPRDLKRELAKELVTELHSGEDAQKAEEHFERTVVNREIPTKIEFKAITNESQTLVDVLVEASLSSSKSEAKRLIEQGGVYVNEKRVTDPNVLFDSLMNNGEAIIKVGKRKFIKVGHLEYNKIEA